MRIKMTDVELLKYIRKNSGCTQAAICKRFHITGPTLVYHLTPLLESGQIKSYGARPARYYLKGANTDETRKKLRATAGVVSSEHKEKVLDFLRRNRRKEGYTQASLVHELNLSQGTISKVLQALKNDGLVIDEGVLRRDRTYHAT